MEKLPFFAEMALKLELFQVEILFLEMEKLTFFAERALKLEVF